MIRAIILALILAGCSAPPEVEKEEPEAVQMPVKVRPNPTLRTAQAWYYCDREIGYILISRAPIVDGRVMGVTHGRVFLDWMAECEDLILDWDSELSNRERWE